MVSLLSLDMILPEIMLFCCANEISDIARNSSREIDFFKRPNFEMNKPKILGAKLVMVCLS